MIEVDDFLPETGRWQTPQAADGGESSPGAARGDNPLHNAPHGPSPRAGEE